jgi:hypothetical protein
MAGVAQGSAGFQAVIAGISPVIDIEPGGRQPGMTERGELSAVEDKERRRHGMETEGIAFPQHHTGGLAPDFDDEGFGHGEISLVRLTWSRSDGSTRVEVVEAFPIRSKDLLCGFNVARSFFRHYKLVKLSSALQRRRHHFCEMGFAREGDVRAGRSRPSRREPRPRPAARAAGDRTIATVYNVQERPCGGAQGDPECPPGRCPRRWTSLPDSA